MKRMTFLLMTAALAGGIATAASAQSASQVPAERAAGGHDKVNFLDNYDTNKDAIVTGAEFIAQRDADYKRIDSNSDNSVAESEYVGEFEIRLDLQLKQEREMQMKQAHARFGVVDKNKDGRISDEEFKASGQSFFKVFDSNGDGTVDERDTAESY